MPNKQKAPNWQLLPARTPFTTSANGPASRPYIQIGIHLRRSRCRLRANAGRLGFFIENILQCHPPFELFVVPRGGGQGDMNPHQMLVGAVDWLRLAAKSFLKKLTEQMTFGCGYGTLTPFASAHRTRFQLCRWALCRIRKSPCSWTPSRRATSACS